MEKFIHFIELEFRMAMDFYFIIKYYKDLKMKSLYEWNNYCILAICCQITVSQKYEELAMVLH